MGRTDFASRKKFKYREFCESGIVAEKRIVGGNRALWERTLYIKGLPLSSNSTSEYIAQKIKNRNSNRYLYDYVLIALFRVTIKAQANQVPMDRKAGRQTVIQIYN